MEPSQPSFSGAHRWWIALNTGLSIAAVVALVVMINYLADGYSRIYHWSRDASFQLSPQTLQVLDSLTNDVDITIFFEANGRNQQIYGLTKSLLTEYHRSCPRHIHVRTLDYTREVGEAKELLARNNMTGLDEKDFVLFEANGHTKLVYAGELAEYDFSDLLAGRSQYVRRKGFRGEMYFTADIFAVSYPQPMKAYFLYGHGENDPGGPGTETSKLGAYSDSKLAAILEKEINCPWERLSLAGTNPIPADCALLIIAGPREGVVQPAECDKIATYLIKGGRLLALLPKECGLEPVLRNWNVQIPNDLVMETDEKYVPGDGLTFFAAELTPHPIINPLASEKISIRMVATRPVFPLDGGKVPGGPDARYLALTTANGIDLEKRRGRYPLIVAVEQGVVKGVSSPKGGGTRIVVAGDSDFLDDQMIDSYAGNHLFAWQALNWLLQRPQIMLAGLGPQPIKEYQFYMTGTQAKVIDGLFLAAMPGAVLLLGGLVWLRRRS